MAFFKRWAKRLVNTPMLVGLHYQHCKAYLAVQRAQRDLHWACETFDADGAVVRGFTKDLEEKLEAISDLDERMNKLWH